MAVESCEHGEDVHDCNRPCRRCGHPCGAHGAERDWCGSFVEDENGFVVDCGCTGYTDDPQGLEAMAEAITDAGGAR